MPGALDSPATPAAAQAPALAQEGAFDVVKQKVWLEINPLSNSRSIAGRTEITLIPHSQNSRTLYLNNRQAEVTGLSTSVGKAAKFRNKAPYLKASLPQRSSANQAFLLQQRLNDSFQPLPLPELEVDFGKAKFPEVRADELDGLDGVSGLVMGEVTVNIDFRIKNVRDGLQFVGCNQEDMRYPHVYTHAYAGSAASCLFPCVDNGSTRYEWELVINTPKTIGDALALSGRSQEAGTRFSEEDKARDITVVCSGELTDEMPDKHDHSKKETSFRLEDSILAQHVGFAIGPFERVNLSAFRESGEDDKLGKSAIQLHGFCLPGRSEEVQNTCFPLAKAIDFCVQTFNSYPFNNYKVTFVDDMVEQGKHCASLSICTSRLLFPEDILEPLNHVTRYLVFCVASQWFGVNIIPAQPKDQYVTVGIAYFMADVFMRKLAGTNEYRYFQKRQADRVFESDVRRPNLLDIGQNLWLDPAQKEFLGLKSSMVMFILDRRLVKANGTVGLSRIIFKICLQNSSGDLANGSIDHERFMRLCEKHGHLKLESFFDQWVSGVGCPHFQVTQRFNKKRLVVEMTIKQVQHETPEDPLLKADEFLRDTREEEREIYAGETQPVFRGPMTIRIHEADGTPYEHIVEIKDMITRIEIPYNTKYKRIKRTRRNKEKLAQGGGRPDEEAQAGVYMLGDNLSSAEDIEAWRLEEWSPEEEDRMNSESFEWIRMDADFEWICRMQFNMPPHMYLSQLQQDKDVVAQIESITYFANSKENKMVATFLIRTLMDRRYFYGIRSAAATALSKHAKPQVDNVGLFHLTKAFQTLFCLPNGMIRPNDFSDRALHYIQCAIVRSMGFIRDNNNTSPFEVRKFLLQTLRYNDNSGNEYSDAHFLQAVMRSLASAVPTAEPQTYPMDDTDYEKHDDIAFFRSCVEEIDRHTRIDEWLPSYHNVLSIEGLNAKSELMRAGRIPKDSREFLRYTQTSSHGDVRIAAFDHLLNLGFGSDTQVIGWFLFNLSCDPSAYIRKRLMHIFCRWLGMVATGQVILKKAETNDAVTNGTTDQIMLDEPMQDNILLEADAAAANRQADEARKKTIQGALAALKQELGSDESFKTNIWTATCSPIVSLFEVSILLEVCGWLYEDVESCIIAIKYPRYWKVRSNGLKTNADGTPKLVLTFSKLNKYYTKPKPKWELPIADTIIVPTLQGKKRKSSTFVSDTSMPAPKQKIQKRNSMQNSVAASPTPEPEKKKTILKLKMPGGGGAGSPPPLTPGARTPGGVTTPGGGRSIFKLKPPKPDGGR